MLLQLPRLDALGARFGRRAEFAVRRALADGLRAVTRPADRVVVPEPEELLVVLPGAGPDDVLRVCNEACRMAATLDEAYPFVTFPAKIAAP